MNALIIIRARESAWARKLFPDRHPAMLPICNKPLLDYLVDFASISGCLAVRILLEESGNDVEDWFQAGQKSGIAISYGQSHRGESLDSLLTKNARFCNQGPLLIYDGFFFLHYDQHKSVINLSAQEETGLISSCSGGLLLYASDQSCLRNLSASDKDNGWQLSGLQSSADYYQLVQHILHTEADKYVLPGYSCEEGVFLGRGIKRGKHTRLIGPAIIGDNVRLGERCTIGPGTVIGNNSIIDSDSEIISSLMLSDCYLGKNLSLTGKIVVKNMLILPECGSWLKIRDDFLLAPLEENRPQHLFHRMLAILLLMIMSPCYLILQIGCRLQRDWQMKKRKILLDHHGHTTWLSDIHHPRGKFCSHLFRRLSLHIIPKLKLVCNGQLALVGTLIRPATSVNRQQLKDFSDYQPGVFTYSEYEQLAAEQLEAEISERYYLAEHSYRQDLKIICGLLLTSFFMKTSKENYYGY